MSTVYILQENPHSPKNFLPAEEFGELVILFQHHISPTLINRCIAQLREKLRGMTKNDWIIPVGHPALIAAAGYVAHDLTGEINILSWDQQTRQYIPIRINPNGPNPTGN